MIRQLIFAHLLLGLGACAPTSFKHVVPEPEHLSCVVDSDCTLAKLSCSTCGDPVAKRFALELSTKAQHICRNYRGPVVDCPPSGSSACQQNKCVFTLDQTTQTSR